jgi:phosphatidate cytidylyltransferase
VNWKGFLIRLLLVGVAFPVFAVLIFVVPHFHHLALNIIVVFAAVTGAFEMAALFRARKIPTSSVLAPVLAAAFPIGAYLEVSGWVPPTWLGIWLPAAVGILLMRAIFFRGGRKLASTLAYASSSVFTFFYPGFFIAWIVRLSGLPDASLSILLFLCLVFGNDMSAYFAGSLWGASTRLNLEVSPQKSILGFAAGLLGSFIVVGLFALIVPSFPRFGIPARLALGLCSAMTVILGDLLESGMKRSAGVKDSGGVIPGRGGMLDSVDSMIFTAPLFYYFILLASG